MPLLLRAVVFTNNRCCRYSVVALPITAAVGVSSVVGAVVVFVVAVIIAAAVAGVGIVVVVVVVGCCCFYQQQLLSLFLLKTASAVAFNGTGCCH